MSGYLLRSNSTSSMPATSNGKPAKGKEDVLTQKDLDTILKAIDQSKSEISGKIDILTTQLGETNERVAVLEEIGAGTRLDAVEDAIKEFKVATEDLKKTKLETENRSIMHELKMKERNIVVFGVPQYHKWESREASRDVVYNYILPYVCNIPTSETIHIEDAHRLMGDAYNDGNNDNDIGRDFPVVGAEEEVYLPLKKPYPFIFRVSNVITHKLIMKAFFDNLHSFNRRQGNPRIYVAERHLPKRMMDDRKELLPFFKEAKRNREKPRWQIDHKNAVYYFKTKVGKRVIMPKATYTRYNDGENTPQSE